MHCVTSATPLSTRNLILNLVHGLKPHFSSTADNITDFDPLPDFVMAHDKLVLKELYLANEGKFMSQMALYMMASPSRVSACCIASSGLGALGLGSGDGDDHSGGSSGSCGGVGV